MPNAVTTVNSMKMSLGVVLIVSFLASLPTEAWSQGESATLPLTLQPTPLKGGCPSREVIAQIHEDIRTAIEETVEPARKMLHEQQAAVNSSESDYCWKESWGGNGQCCISGKQWEEARAEILDTIRGDAQYPAISCKQITEMRPELPSGYYWILIPSGTVVQLYCDITRNSTGGWTRVAYLNMSDLTHSCPPGWRYIESPKRTCGRTGGPGYETVTYSTHGVEYSHVCGQIRGYQGDSPDAFYPFTNDPSRTIDDIYVDGVSVTYGTSPRKHIWTFTAALGDSRNDSSESVCHCTHPPETDSLTVPPFMENDYFCEAGIDIFSHRTFYPDDPLWDGQDCPSPNTCCQFNSPPWFCKTLAEPTTEDIEVRLMADEDITNEDIPIELIEIYIQ